MRILFVHPSAQMSVSDVARGYRSALERMGHDIRDYRLFARISYHSRAVPSDVAAKDPTSVFRAASETILNEALYHQADIVIIISGLNLHPIALWLLGKVGIPAAAIFTESPYDDPPQAQWADLTQFDSPIRLHVATNDRYSAMKYGWQLLAPAFDPAIHRPVPPNGSDVCDVLMIGSGWPERQAMLEAVNWSGINLKLMGIWPGIANNPSSPLFRFYSPLIVNNEYIAEMYCSAKININFHRKSDIALSVNPRVVELAACGAFQLSDPRPDLTEMFGVSVPTFTNATELESQIRHFLSHDGWRHKFANQARDRVQHHTFDNRAAALLSALHINDSKVDNRETVSQGA